MNNPNYQLSLLKVPVSDIAVSAAFYRDALGFMEQFVAEEYGWAQMRAGEVPLALYVLGMGGGDGAMGVSVGFRLSLPTDDFDALAAELLARDALVEDQVHQGDDGTTFLTVRDPDENTLNIGRGEGEGE